MRTFLGPLTFFVPGFFSAATTELVRPVPIHHLYRDHRDTIQFTIQGIKHVPQAAEKHPLRRIGAFRHVSRIARLPIKGSKELGTDYLQTEAAGPILEHRYVRYTVICLHEEFVSAENKPPRRPAFAFWRLHCRYELSRHT
jgi:hypothetical protein